MFMNISYAHFYFIIFFAFSAATITATSDCKVWSIERMSYRSVISQLRYEQQQEKNAFIRQCEVSGRLFTDIFDGSQLDDLTIAMKVDVYEEGQVILREGEMGDTFYIVKSGRVERYRNDKNGDEKSDGVVDVKKSFGTTSLLKGAPSPLTYRAASSVQLYYLTRKDFEEIMGSFKDALDGTIVSRMTRKSESKRTIKTSASYLDRCYECEFDELDFFNILGKGAFGQVTLVQSKKTKKVFALKAQSKNYIAKKNQKEHVLNEYRIMKEIEHPCILGIHCAMQDKQHLYFLLDLLPGEYASVLALILLYVLFVAHYYLYHLCLRWRANAISCETSSSIKHARRLQGGCHTLLCCIGCACI